MADDDDSPGPALAGRRPSGRGNTAAVHRQLRTAILRCEIPADTPLSQVQLAKQFGVSHTPLREALRMLQREGLVEAELNQRVRVAGFSVADLDQLYAARIVIEALAIRITVPLLAEHDLACLAGHLDQMDAFAAVEDYDGWDTHHRAFHCGLVRLSGARLVAEVEKLSDHAARYRRFYTTQTPGAWAAGSPQHRAVFAACRARSPAAAAEQLARHYSTVALRVIAYVAPEYDPAAVRTALRMILQSAEA
jgi:DNA-binding GntR family transcriptional regulator